MGCSFVFSEPFDMGLKKGYHTINKRKGGNAMKKTEFTTLVKLLITPVLMIVLGIALVVRPDSASAILFCVVTLALGLWLVRNPLRLAAALGRIAGLLILVRAVRDIANAARWKCGMKYALISAIVGALLIVLPMTTSRAVWVILGILVVVLGVLIAVDRVKLGKLLPSGDDNIIDAQ